MRGLHDIRLPPPLPTVASLLPPHPHPGTGLPPRPQTRTWGYAVNSTQAAHMASVATPLSPPLTDLNRTQRSCKHQAHSGESQAAGRALHCNGQLLTRTVVCNQGGQPTRRGACYQAQPQLTTPLAPWNQAAMEPHATNGGMSAVGRPAQPHNPSPARTVPYAQRRHDPRGPRRLAGWRRRDDSRGGPAPPPPAGCMPSPRRLQTGTVSIAFESLWCFIARASQCLGPQGRNVLLHRL